MYSYNTLRGHTLQKVDRKIPTFLKELVNKFIATEMMKSNEPRSMWKFVKLQNINKHEDYKVLSSPVKLTYSLFKLL